jgi:hypothetical protein
VYHGVNKEEFMKFHEGFGKFYSGVIGLLLWVFPIAGGIIGGYLTKGLLKASESYARWYDYAPKQSVDSSGFFMAIVVGILVGVLLDVILLGPMVVIINIQNYLEDIRNEICPIEHVETAQKIEEGDDSSEDTKNTHVDHLV